MVGWLDQMVGRMAGSTRWVVLGGWMDQLNLKIGSTPNWVRIGDRAEIGNICL